MKSGICIKIAVTTETGDEHELQTRPLDLAEWERQNGQGFIGALSDPGKMTIDLLGWLAWRVAKRERKTDLDYDAWLATIVDITPVDGGSAPFDPAVSTG